MKKVIKRVFNPRKLLVVLTLTAIFLLVLTNKAAAEEQKPYLIKVNRIFNTITIYEKDENGEFTLPVKAMLCSVGRNGATKVGTFQTKEKYRWKLLMGDVWGQYSTRIVGGILFHSVYYYRYGDPATLATNQFNKLGTSASHGCIRLTVEDAKWIYDNCASGTTVVIYDDKKSPGPLGKPEAVRIPSTVRWDPTDPNPKNPYLQKKPSIAGIKNIRIPWGEEVNLMKDVKAKSSLGIDISNRVQVDGHVDTLIPGKYNITYSVVDPLQRKTEKTIIVTVEESKVAPVIKGFKDQVIGNMLIDEDFVMTDVEAYCSDKKLNKEDIQVSIDEISDVEYYITYTISVGKKSTMEHATIMIDKESPVFNGIEEVTLPPAQIPDTIFALQNVTVSDNYSNLDSSDIIVTITESPDGSFLVTYEATDDLGNTAKAETIFHY